MSDEDDRTRTEAGRYYGTLSTGKLVEVSKELLGARPPDFVICRRLADYPGGRAPRGAAFGPCAICHARIAFNPLGPHQDVPKRCLQCANIEPLPYPEPQ